MFFICSIQNRKRKRVKGDNFHRIFSREMQEERLAFDWQPQAVRRAV
jgi:hypothetical protein